MLCVGALHPLYGFAHAWRIDRNRRGEFPMVCGVGSYLIHSPRVLPTPRGDYFTANGRVEHSGYRRKREGAGERTTGTAHVPFRKSMSRPERRDPNRSYRRASMQTRLAARNVTYGIFLTTMCYALWRYDDSRINEITILYSLVQFFKMETQLFGLPILTFYKILLSALY